MKIFKNIIISYSIALSVMLILSLIYSLLINLNILNSSYDKVKNITLVIGILSFFSLGLTGSILSKKRAILVGLFYSTISILILLLLSLTKVTTFNQSTLIKIIIYIFTLLIGSLIGRKFRKKSLN